ncbi:hypothetical protein F5Y15DRAFT_412124 [Xylariaceae sp. FL0016]|nr:hypothetical protein F5Y15DRAFT_412124 [Xylariaceae sp. FL0016]
MYGTIKRKLNALAEEGDGDGGLDTPSKGKSARSAPSTPASSRKRKAAEKEENEDSDEKESTEEEPVVNLVSNEDSSVKSMRT